MSQKQPRLTRSRLGLLMDMAKAKGGRVNINLATGEASIDFGDGADARPANEEGLRIEETMSAAMGGRKA